MPPSPIDPAPKLADLIRRVAEERRRNPPTSEPVEWEFIDTAEGITLVMEDGMVRGATAVELAMRDEIEHGRGHYVFDDDAPAIRRAEYAIVRALRDAGLGSQSQVTHVDRFEIATDAVIVRVELND